MFNSRAVKGTKELFGLEVPANVEGLKSSLHSSIVRHHDEGAVNSMAVSESPLFFIDMVMDGLKWTCPAYRAQKRLKIFFCGLCVTPEVTASSV